MAADRFEDCLAFTWRPDMDGQPLHTTAGDHGGATSYGVTLAVYAAWRRARGISVTSAHDLAAATKAELSELVRARYWDAVRGDDLGAGPDLLAFDFGFVSGPGESVRLLQDVVGAEVDGDLGPQTLAAVQACDPADLVQRLGDRHQAFYESLAQFPEFGRGWTRRNDARVQLALAACAPAPSTADTTADATS